LESPERKLERAGGREGVPSEGIGGKDKRGWGDTEGCVQNKKVPSEQGKKGSAVEPGAETKRGEYKSRKNWVFGLGKWTP